MTRSVLLVANPDPAHVGAHLMAAAADEQLTAHLADVREAWQGPVWRRKAAWWIQGHRPVALRAFSERVAADALRHDVRAVISTGLAPIAAPALDALGRAGIARVNYLTDDPWNPAHRAPWFLNALSKYDVVFSPRRANLDDLRSLGGPRVEYLPFGFNPAQHFPDPPVAPADVRRFAADIVFAGGADPDRAAVLGAFVRGGLAVAVYGGYWERYRATRALARGHLDLRDLRRAIGGAKVSLCLVRRANRDGQSMRTYEVAAMGGCMLVEHTPEHEELFGEDGHAVAYFRNTTEAMAAARALVADPARRAALGARVRELVTAGGHTYRDRLRQMIQRIHIDTHEDRLRHPGPVSRI